jgi:hypothetical protein
MYDEDYYGLSKQEVSYGDGESDPNGVDQHTHGAKLDNGKPDCSLLLMFGRALSAVAEVGTYGAAKYTRGGWRGVVDGINRYTAAMIRHLFKEDKEEMDTDLPVMHAAQVAWNALARLELMLREKETK